jgi:hypothetical protein
MTRWRALMMATCAAASIAVTACSSSTPGATTASSSGGTSGTPSSGGSSPTPQLVGTTRTVIAPLGLNMHSQPVVSSSNIVGTLQQGASLSVLDYQAQSGGWFKVMGQTTTGWIVADPTLTAQGDFTVFPSDAFNAMYPQGWTFRVEAPNVTRFVPTQQGQQSIVVATAASTSAFPNVNTLGYASTYTQQVVPCGYTGDFVEYMRSGNAAVPPSPGPLIPTTPLYAEIRLRFDAAHAMLIAFDYQSKDQLSIFENFYNAISYPYPGCRQGATPPGTSPTPT